MAKKLTHGYVKGKTYYKNESEDQRLRMGGSSWTISLKDIEEEDIEKIQYRTDEHIYEIDYKHACNVGWEATFKGEKKLIVPVKNWTITTLKQEIDKDVNTEKFNEVAKKIVSGNFGKKNEPLPAEAYDPPLLNTIAGNVINNKKPFIQKLQEQLKDAEHIIKATLIRKEYVTPTYLARMSEEYAEKYNLEI